MWIGMSGRAGASRRSAPPSSAITPHYLEPYHYSLRRTVRRSNYDKFPAISVGDADQCAVGWSAIAAQLNGAGVICIECYAGVDMERLEAELLREMGSRRVFEASTAYKSPDCLRPMLHQFLGDDPVFGRMNGL